VNINLVHPVMNFFRLLIFIIISLCFNHSINNKLNSPFALMLGLVNFVLLCVVTLGIYSESQFPLPLTANVDGICGKRGTVFKLWIKVTAMLVSVLRHFPQS